MKNSTVSLVIRQCCWFGCLFPSQLSLFEPSLHSSSQDRNASTKSTMKYPKKINTSVNFGLSRNRHCSRITSHCILWVCHFVFILFSSTASHCWWLSTRQPSSILEKWGGRQDNDPFWGHRAFFIINHLSLIKERKSGNEFSQNSINFCGELNCWLQFYQRFNQFFL